LRKTKAFELYRLALQRRLRACSCWFFKNQVGTVPLVPARQVAVDGWSMLWMSFDFA
jgi:hypothetical protein